MGTIRFLQFIRMVCGGDRLWAVMQYGKFHFIVWYKAKAPIQFQEFSPDVISVLLRPYIRDIFL